MANIKYRSSSTPTVPNTTTVKGAPLTNLEVDGNFKSLSNAVDAVETSVSNLDTVVQTKVEVSEVLAYSIALG